MKKGKNTHRDRIRGGHVKTLTDLLQTRELRQLRRFPLNFLTGIIVLLPS